MATISADVTPQLKNWIDLQLGTGLYKSTSEIVRELIREKMELDEMADFKQWYVKKVDKRALEQIEYLERKGLM